MSGAMLQELAATENEMQSPEVVTDGLRLDACYRRLQAARAGWKLCTRGDWRQQKTWRA